MSDAPVNNCRCGRPLNPNARCHGCGTYFCTPCWLGHWCENNPRPVQAAPAVIGAMEPLADTEYADALRKSAAFAPDWQWLILRMGKWARAEETPCPICGRTGDCTLNIEVSIVPAGSLARCLNVPSERPTRADAKGRPGWLHAVPWRATPTPCPMCGGAGTCTLSRDGAILHCAKVESENGTHYHPYRRIRRSEAA